MFNQRILAGKLLVCNMGLPPRLASKPAPRRFALELVGLFEKVIAECRSAAEGAEETLVGRLEFVTAILAVA